MTDGYPYLHGFIDARGKKRYVFRRRGHKQVTVKGKYGSPEFIDNYRSLVDQTAPKTIGQAKARAGTVDAIAIAYFKSEAFDGLARETQKTWRRIIERFRDHATPSGRRYGDNSIATLNEAAIKRFLEGKKPNAQKTQLKAVRALIRFAIYQGELPADPTEKIKPPKAGIKSKGHMTWLSPQIAQYRERWPLGTIARLALELLLNIAARRHDAHEFGTQHIRGRKLVWRPHKTLRSTGKLLSIRIRPELQAAMDAIQTRRDGVLTLLVNDYGRSFASAAAFGNKFADWCRAAGLKPVLCDDGKVRSYRAHGLRKAALMSLAHAGATGVELMAVSGHSSLAQVQEYLDAVDRDRAAGSAMTKLDRTGRG
jgi:integrase-like protein